MRAPQRGGGTVWRSQAVGHAPLLAKEGSGELVAPCRVRHADQQRARRSALWLAPPLSSLSDDNPPGPRYNPVAMTRKIISRAAENTVCLLVYDRVARVPL